MIELNKNNIQQKNKEALMWKKDLAKKINLNLKKDTSKKSEYVEVYLDDTVRKQLYEIGYIKFYYLDYAIPSMYKYKDKYYNIIDSMWINPETGQKIERKELGFLSRLLATIGAFIIASIFGFDILIHNKELIISVLIWLVVTWTSDLQPPKNFRATTKKDYENL